MRKDQNFRGKSDSQVIFYVKGLKEKLFHTYLSEHGEEAK